MSSNNLPSLSYCHNLLDNGFSLLTTKDDKLPNIKWKELQKTAPSKDSFENFYNLPTTKSVGIITGYNNLEVIDIDLKVFSTPKEKDDFWNEFLSFLHDNIEDFEQKFVIVKTVNNGFHILYRCNSIQGNSKLAKIKTGETLIETRGIGGYVWIYSNFLQKRSYTEIIEISENDRMLLFSCCKTYNHIEDIEIPEKKYKEVEKIHFETNVKVWDDFNNRNSVWDLVSSEFQIVRKLTNKVVIKRNGAKSPHSGYIFDNSKCMYLFSTSTRYPNEKLLNPFHIYTIQNHNGDFSAAAKELYRLGYGSRFSNKKKVEVSKEISELKTDEFPIEIFPYEMQNFIKEIALTLNASIDYLGCSLLWVLSLCVGNSTKIQIKNGWQEAGVIWLAIVGKAGIGKTHNIQAITKPLTKLNEREIQIYADENKKYKDYIELPKKEKELAMEVKQPKKTQFIVGDITIEAFFDYHSENPNGIGILRDELSGWIKDLNKYRPGSDLETYLSCWSNQQIILTRKTAANSFIPKAYVPIIGGVQPSILSLHYTSENKDNGFIDRILLCYPELEVEYFNESEISRENLEWYNDYIVNLFDYFKNNIQYDNFGRLKSTICYFDDDAKKEWIRIFNKITDLQNSEEENEYMKSMLPKQKSYVARFSLLMNILYSYDAYIEYTTVTKKAVLAAEKLSDYFIKMAKKNKFETMENKEIAETIKFSGKKTPKEKFLALFSENNNLNRTKIAEQLNVSRVTINNWIKEINCKPTVN